MTNKFFRKTLSHFVFTSILVASCSGSGYKKISILGTTDMHGVILHYDFIEQRDLKASLVSSITYINRVRAEKDITVLLDSGDNLQGQPEVYYYNYIVTVSPHFMSESMNFEGYDAAAAGNHDIEAGHSVYDRIVKEYKFPLMAAKQREYPLLFGNGK
jgi:2',3'-cyclic-nucleotide 2'-phosphodiesterase/3'-nucleotidase